MSAEDELDQFVAYLRDELPEEESRRFQTRLKDDPALCDRFMRTAIEESVIAEWAKRRRHAGQIEEEAWGGILEQDEGESAPTPGRATSRPGRWGRAGKGLVAAAFLLAPAALVGLTAYRFGDYGLALSGWANSVSSLIQLSALVLASLLAVSWLAARRLGWGEHVSLCCLGGGASLLTATVACHVALSDYTEREVVRRSEIVQSHVWVSYDSAYYWPADQAEVTGRPAQEPTDSQIRQELTALRQAGFSGLFIHECRDGQIPVPRIAREVGFTAVVQGIRVADPKHLDADKTQQQMRNALSVRDLVDAFVLGELNASEVSFPALKKELARMRWLTGKPVTASFLHDDDLGVRGVRFRELEDFTVRSLARPWKGDSGDPDEAVRAVKQGLDMVRQQDDKPALLTTVFYPSGGGQGFTEENQERFFRGVRELPVPPGVQLVYFSSFDRPWARKLSEVTRSVPRYEGYTGLFSSQLAKDGREVKLTPKKVLGLFKPGS
jgi:hypothetical protein